MELGSKVVAKIGTKEVIGKVVYIDRDGHVNNGEMVYEDIIGIKTDNGEVSVLKEMVKEISDE